MSYILDALRRAEADRERGRGAVPGLNAPQAPPVPGLPVRAGAPFAAARWVGAGAAGAALALALGALAWWLLRPAPEPAAPTAAIPPSPAPAIPTPAQITVSTPAPSMESTATAATQAPPAQAAPARTQAPATKAPVAKVLAASAPMPQAMRAPKSAPPPAADQASDTVPAFNALPDEVRRAMPKLVISGSVYSADPRSRFIMVNGELGYEGQDVAPGVRLERIAPRQATFLFRGQRFTLPH